MQGHLSHVARTIIKSNIYLTLATCDRKQIPWAAPVYYAVNSSYHFYFISQIHSLHSEHILHNPRVGIAIFDSHQPEGTGNGVQASGKATLLKIDEIPEALTWYKTRYIPMNVASFTGKVPYRFFKIIPEHFYILDPKAPVDVRVEVSL